MLKGHMAKDCPARVKQESTGSTVKSPNARMATSDDPMEYLLDDDGVQVRIMDHGSQPQCAQVSVGGITMKGVVDSGSDILYSGLFLNQKFLHKCLNINFGGFIFEVSIFQWF